MSHPRRFRLWDGEEMHLPPHDYVLAGDGKLYTYRTIYGAGIGTREDLVTEVLNEDVEVMHSTGLTDAEGQEIWQGDLVGHLWGHEGVVIWSDQRLQWEITPTNKELSALRHPKVKGNRYENPHLLDQQPTE